MELLAPAGSPDALRAAVEHGADAVYLGGRAFSARASAVNFDDDQLQEALDYCHVRGVKVYVTVNTLLNDNELAEALGYLEKLYLWGADAVITQDLGLASQAKKAIPELELHASTQMTLQSAADIEAVERLGFSRVVLARELSIAEIGEIKKKTRAELEVFVHGAICVSYSGQCLMSSLIGGRSGNRGQCAQPCRLPYKVHGLSQDLPGPHALSPRDLNLIDYLPDLAKAGVTSLKIEGRLKQPDYVGVVVRTYRAALDGLKYDRSDLETVFNRGFTTAYALGSPDPSFITYSSPRGTSSNEVDVNLSNDVRRRVKGFMYANVELGKPLQLTLVDVDGCTAVVESTRLVEGALGQPLTDSILQDKLLRLGNEPLDVEELQISLAPNTYLPLSELNETRRRLVEVWKRERLAPYKNRKLSSEKHSAVPVPSKKQGNLKDPIIAVSVSDLASAEEAIKHGAGLVYYSGQVFKRSPSHYLYELEDVWHLGQKSGVPVFVHIDRLMDDSRLAGLGSFLADQPFDGMLVGSLGGLDLAERLAQGRPIHTDMFFNVYNSASAKSLQDMGASCVTASVEMRLDQIRELVGRTSLEVAMVVHGPLESMVTKHCILRDTGCRYQCQRGENVVLEDPKGFHFPVMFDRWCRMHILNSRELAMPDKIEALRRTGVSYLRIEGRYKTSDWVGHWVKSYSSALDQGSIEFDLGNEYTRGHYYRGVK